MSITANDEQEEEDEGEVIELASRQAICSEIAILLLLQGVRCQPSTSNTPGHITASAC